MKVTLLGASGFIGGHLAAALRNRGDAVREASLRDVDAAAQACADADVVVNLAGAPVARRWSARQKEAIRRSRVDAPRALLDRIAAFPARPRRYVSASAIGYYGTSRAARFVESSPAGSDFLARVCVAWEAEAMRAREFGMEAAVVRTGLVLGIDGGALTPLLVPFRLGLGGVVGDGEQWMSWIHIDDEVGVYLHAIDGGSGPYNAVAPNPVTNRTFTRALSRVLRRPAFVPLPAFAARAALGEGATILLDGQAVLPERTLASGYAFRYSELEPALRAILA